MIRKVLLLLLVLASSAFAQQTGLVVRPGCNSTTVPNPSLNSTMCLDSTTGLLYVFTQTGFVQVVGGGGGTGGVTTLGSGTVNGTTAGSVAWVEYTGPGPTQIVSLTYNAYENTTATVQSITLPAAFPHTPVFNGDCPLGTLPSAGQVNLPVSMTAVFSGSCSIQSAFP